MIHDRYTGCSSVNRLFRYESHLSRPQKARRLQLSGTAKEKMKIGGLQKVSLIDYPGKISAIIFTQGCNFRCPYCHNPELVEKKLYRPCLSVENILEFLESRRGKLDAVTITGGEPTLQEGLIPFIGTIRKMGFSVKLDSNGSRPDVLARLIEEKLLDFIAMDVKAPAAKYAGVVRAAIPIDVVRESIGRILRSNLPHEFRTTVVSSQLSPEDILEIAHEIIGAKRYAMQKFRPDRTLNKKYLSEATYADEAFLNIKKQLEKVIPLVMIR